MSFILPQYSWDYSHEHEREKNIMLHLLYQTNIGKAQTMFLWIFSTFACAILPCFQNVKICIIHFLFSLCFDFLYFSMLKDSKRGKYRIRCKEARSSLGIFCAFYVSSEPLPF